ncbi:patatin-like phospholipase family protein [Actinacidiphila acididurans]|uniref:Patatin-like phospholipase family protein n=1 Tax=Actinacidiphila acididurans TaxID=2784346 RepID=A0ABS2TZM3_9ACTN|nr:patatin-like phospholipase family protein [Actinacidiphila acididurans]MBM9507941.1 patatin-like phospholipase family protein [Actinacidiphila acididurans]
MTGAADFTRLGQKALEVAGRVGVPEQGTAGEPRAIESPAASPASPPAPRVPLRIGLVLAGGGAKGAYELGVLDYMAEMGAQVSAIAGTSIGALNGAVLASEDSFFQGVRRLAGFWERFSTRMGVAPSEDRGLPLDAAGVAVESTARQLARLGPRLLALKRRLSLLEELVDQAVDPERIRTGRPLWVAAYPLMDREAVPERLRYGVEIARWLGGARATIIRLNDLPAPQIREAVLASAALPFVFPTRVIDGCVYLDGGLGRGDRTPVRAFAEEEHCDVLVVLHLHPDARVAPGAATGLVRIDIRPSLPIIPPGPLGPLTGLMSFSPERVGALRALGYRDAAARFGEIERVLTRRVALTGAESAMLSALRRLRGDRGDPPPR